MLFRSCVRAFSSCGEQGYSSLQCEGFSLRWLLLLRSTGSRHSGFCSVARGLSSCGSRALECRLSSYGARASLLHGMWELPGPGLEPLSPALAGGFLTTAPPGKPSRLLSTAAETLSWLALGSGVTVLTKEGVLKSDTPGLGHLLCTLAK